MCKPKFHLLGLVNFEVLYAKLIRYVLVISQTITPSQVTNLQICVLLSVTCKYLLMCQAYTTLAAKNSSSGRKRTTTVHALHISMSILS